MITQQQATSDLTAVMKGYKLSVNEVASAVDKLTAVDAESASSAGGIAQALEQVANVANTAGVSLDQTIGMISTISDVTQREPSSVGQALRTMIARFSNVKAGVYGTMNVDSDNAEATENVNDIEKVLKKVGIQVRSSELDFRSFSDVLSDVADKWDTLDDVSKKAIATSVAGVRQSEQFYALMNNWDKYQKLTEVSANSAGTAEKKYLSYTEQLEAAQKRLQAAWESLAQNADLNKWLTWFYDGMAKIVEWAPVLLRYALRIFATMQAYKIPTLLGSAKNFLFDAGGLIGGRGQRVRNYLGGSHGYDAQLQESKVGTIGGGLFDKTPTGQLIKALKENTAAQQGNTTATQQNTSVKNGGSPTAGLPQEPYNMSAPAGSKWDPALNNGKGGYRDIATGRMVPGQYDYAKAGYITNPEDALTDSGYIFIGDTKTGVGKYVTQKEDGSFVGVGPDAKTVEMSFKDKLQYERRANKQTKGNNAAMASAVVSGIVSAALTARTSGQWENKILGTTEDREYSDDTKATIRGLTGIGAAAGGIAGALISKSPTGAAVGSQLGGGLMDFLSNKIGPYLDREAFARKDLVEIGEKGLTVMANIKSSVSTLEDLSDKTMTPENYKSASAAKDNILKTLLSKGNEEALSEFRSNLSDLGYTGSLSNILNDQYMNGSKSQRKSIAKALSVAQKKTSSAEYVKSQAENIASLKEKIDNQYLGSGWNAWGAVGQLTGPLAGAIGGGLTGNAGNGAAQFFTNSSGVVGSVLRATNQHLNGGAATSDWSTKDANGNIQSGDYLKNLTQMYYDAATKAGVGDKFKIKNYQTAGEKWLNWLSLGTIEKHETAIDTSAMSTDEKYAMYDQLLKYAQDNNLGELTSSISDIVDTLDSIKEQQEAIYDQINEQNADTAVLTAGIKDSSGKTTTRSISDMTATELKSLGPDAIREMVAEELAKNGGISGHDIWVNGEGSELTSYAKNLIDSSLKQYDNIYGVITGESYTLAEALGLPQSETKNKILTSFASAIGTTIDKLDAYAGKYGDLSLGDFLATPSDLRTKLESYAKVLSEIGSSTGLTNENIENIISQYPDLIQYLGDTSTLISKLISKMSQTSDLYSSGTATTILGSEDLFANFKKQLEAKNPDLYKALSSTYFGKATSFSDLQAWYGTGASGYKDQLSPYITEYLNFNADIATEQTVLNEAISYQTKMMGKQIDNLTSQKDALGKINDQREYGNKLIEAQLKLENAQKEKKLVYREGVGFSYESDQTAIKEAQDALDDLDITKQQDLLQTEIDQLTSEKELLSDLADDSELKNLKEIYEGWAKSNGVINDDQSKILQTLMNLYGSFGELNIGTSFQTGAGVAGATATQTSNAVDTAWDEYQKAKGTSGEEAAWNKLKKAVSAAESADSSYTVDKNIETVLNHEPQSNKTFYFLNHGGKKVSGKEGDALIDSDKDAGYIIQDAKNGKAFVYSAGNQAGVPIDATFANLHSATIGQLLQALYESKTYNPNGGPILINGWDGAEELASFNGQQIKRVSMSEVSDDDFQSTFYAAALGSYGLPGGQTLLNEKGTEAIVTPYGTLTSLPSGTGVVPADLTQKLYDLSMVSPSILNALGAYKTGAGVAVSGIGGSSTDESLNINSLTMNVTAGSDFDADAFAEQLKQQAALTKRNH